MLFEEPNITLIRYVACELGNKYEIDLDEDSDTSIFHAREIMSVDDWNLFVNCLKYPNYGALLVCKGTMTRH